jgi:pimeloyl-ACP methyl ester carboxylesterase
METTSYADEVEPWVLSKRETVTGGTVAWDRFGDGAPVVLVHGTPSWSFLWRNVVPPLAERVTVYALDLLGYGDSERRDDQDMSIAAQGRALAELLGRWGLEEPALVGHDVGGAIVLRAHLVEGRPVHRIGLVDAVALNPWNTPTTQHIRAHLDAYRTMPPHIYEEIVKAHLRTAVHRPLDDETLAAYLAPWQGEAGQAAYFRKIAQWTEEDVGALEPLLSTLDVPVRIVWGEDDRWLGRDIALRLQTLIPDAELRLVAGAGHFAPEDEPEAVARELGHFLGASSQPMSAEYEASRPRAC